MELKKIFCMEIGYAFIAGTIPAAIIAYFGGEKAFLPFIRAVTPSEYLIRYFVVLLAIQFLTTFINGWYKNKFISRNFSKFWQEVGFTFLGLTRALLGTFIAAALFALFYLDSAHISSKAVQMIFVIVALTLSNTYIAHLKEKYAPKPSFFKK